MKDYLIQNPNASKHRHRNKGSGKMQKKGAKFDPKTWAYFSKSWAIGKNTVANFLRQSENPGNKKKTQKKPAQLNTIENMEADKAIITAKSPFIVHSVRGRLEGATHFAYDTVNPSGTLVPVSRGSESGMVFIR